MDSYTWKHTCLAKTKAEKAKISLPTQRAFCVQLEEGVGTIHGGSSVGAKGLLVNLKATQHGQLFQHATRNERASAELPYLNTEYGAGVVIGMIFVCFIKDFIHCMPCIFQIISSLPTNFIKTFDPVYFRSDQNIEFSFSYIIKWFKIQHIYIHGFWIHACTTSTIRASIA